MIKELDGRGNFQFSTPIFSGVDFWGRKCVKSAAVLVALPRVFPLSVCATFMLKIQTFTHKFTPLSSMMLPFQD